MSNEKSNLKTEPEKTLTVEKFLETQKFEENHFLGNIKLFLGIICLVFTAIAYLYPKPFPENYYIVLACVIGYAINSVIYFIFEKYWGKQIFYSGYSADFLNKLNKSSNLIKLLSISSDVKDYCNEYYVWFDVETEKALIYAESVCDEKGYIVREKVVSQFEKIIKDALSKKYE